MLFRSAPLSPAALGIGIQSIPLTPVEEEAGPAMPAFDQAIILSPADVAAGGSAETATSPVDPNFDRGFEPITSAVPVPMPVEEPPAVPEPAVEPVVEQPSEQVVEQSAEPIVALQESAPTAAEVAPATPPADPLVEAAVAMVREATEKELAAEDRKSTRLNSSH